MKSVSFLCDDLMKPLLLEAFASRGILVITSGECNLGFGESSGGGILVIIPSDVKISLKILIPHNSFILF